MELSGLKAQIKQAAREGQAIRQQIPTRHAQERDALWNKKRTLGRRSRYLFLAYGYLRGIPYRRIEPHCREHNDAQWYLLADTLDALGLLDVAVPMEGAPDSAAADKYRRREALRSTLESWIGAAATTDAAPSMGATS